MLLQAGGWSADEHALFVRLRALAFKAASGGASRGGCSRAAVLDRLALMMAGKTRRQVEQHETWCVALMSDPASGAHIMSHMSLRS